MNPLPPPETLKFYLLIQQSTSSMYFSPTGTSMGTSYGSGFYATRDEAEKARTLAILSDKSEARFHIFELDFPNPAYQKTG